MKKLYIIFKLLIIFNSLTNLLWLMYESPVYIYAINLLISMVPVVDFIYQWEGSTKMAIICLASSIDL
jgi:hypothetical protein